MKSREGTITDMVRRYASANSLIRKKQAAEALGFTKDQVVAAVGTLTDQGFLKRVAHGTYEYIDRPMAGKDSPINDRVWRGMRMHPIFSCSELARLGGTTTNYVYKLMRRYRAEGLVAPAGRGTTLGGHHEKKWRLTPKGKQHRERPLVKAFEPDPLVMKTVMLNKLVCSGLARCMPDERARAVRLCGEIETMLGSEQETENES